jgi:hypothetical protein
MVVFSIIIDEEPQYNGSMPPNTLDKRQSQYRDELGYIAPPNRKLPPVPGNNFNTCDRMKRGVSTNLSSSPYSFKNFLLKKENKQSLSACKTSLHCLGI